MVRYGSDNFGDLEVVERQLNCQKWLSCVSVCVFTCESLRVESRELSLGSLGN